MKKLLTLIVISILGVSFLSTQSFASVDGKGNRIFLKKLRKTCGFNGFVMAKKHTQKEWQEIYKSGNLNAEMESFCPGAKDFKEDEEMFVATFLHSFASDSGTIVVG